MKKRSVIENFGLHAEYVQQITPLKQSVMGLTTQLRRIELEVDKCKRRDEQLMILLKALLDKGMNRSGGIQNVGIGDISRFLEKYIKEHISEDKQESSIDLLEELQKSTDGNGDLLKDVEDYEKKE